MCEAIKDIRNEEKENGRAEGIAEGKELGEENYKRKQRTLHDKMKEDGRETEFIDALDDDAKMTSLFEEYGIS